MKPIRPIHADFLFLLDFKGKKLIETYVDVRNFVLEIYPEANELLYHTHALTSVFTISEKLSDGFVMLPIYSQHMNLGFHKGALLKDPNNLLKGTGKLIRHIPIQSSIDYRNPQIIDLVKQAIALATSEMTKPSNARRQVFSKIKT